MIKLSQAINLYNPNAQWTMDNDDYETLEWHSEEIAKPSLTELEALLPQVKQIYVEKEASIAAARAAAEAKLAALGLTADDLKALGL